MTYFSDISSQNSRLIPYDELRETTWILRRYVDVSVYSKSWDALYVPVDNTVESSVCLEIIERMDPKP